ncbi:mediator of RNA polymerase II transcription subunit 15a-like [Dioscorea cayenensis subsp. rotundata]|uniref:Mediator of RNA polymerase II transcription subunit 15a-like n=1 Tax=Dioscorea cayennensis subsp. rotundata TaxID=55577 RepID=A0AB40CAD1_DIOCR|nr:mediator of RNA polymerase II transcription subunit 15a-like [Dioscorea cayenensis subsp. rotundata]
MEDSGEINRNHGVFPDWRVGFQHELRGKAIHKIMGNLMEICRVNPNVDKQQILMGAQYFEAKAYHQATSKDDYSRKIYLILLSCKRHKKDNIPVDPLKSNFSSRSHLSYDAACLYQSAQPPTKAQQPPQPQMHQQRFQSPEALPPFAGAVEQKRKHTCLLGGSSTSATLLTVQDDAFDLIEEIHQKIKKMKGIYYRDLLENLRKIVIKLNQLDALPSHQKQPDERRRLIECRDFVQQALSYLGIGKEKIQAQLMGRLIVMERKIRAYLELQPHKSETPLQTLGQKESRHPGGNVELARQHPPCGASMLRNIDNHANQGRQMKSPSIPSVSVQGREQQQLSEMLSPSDAGDNGQQQMTRASVHPEVHAPGTSAMSASSMTVKDAGSDSDQVKETTEKSCKGKRPIELIINAVQSGTPEVLDSSTKDIASVVDLDILSSSARSSRKKIRLDTSNMHVPLTCGHEVEFAAPSTGQCQANLVTSLVQNEIKEINMRLIDTVVSVNEEEVDRSAAQAVEGMIVSFAFIAVSISPNLISKLDLQRMTPIMSLRLLVPLDYPKSSPVLLDKLPDEQSMESGDLPSKAMSKFNKSLQLVSQPISLGTMAKLWDASIREIMLEYAHQYGGGTFSSRVACWQTCVH